MDKQLETRVVEAAELAVETREGKTKPGIRGYAAVYSSLSRDLGGFREQIAPGVFAKVLAKNPDVRATLNHDPSQLLGRTSSRTLLLEDSPKGLLVNIPELPDTTTGRDVAELVRRGDASRMSFGFRAPVDSWAEKQIDGQQIAVRTLHDFELVDVSVLTLDPAYGDTSVSLRSLAAWIESRVGGSIQRVLLDLLVARAWSDAAREASAAARAAYKGGSEALHSSLNGQLETHIANVASKGAIESSKGAKGSAERHREATDAHKEATGAHKAAAAAHDKANNHYAALMHEKAAAAHEKAAAAHDAVAAAHGK